MLYAVAQSLVELLSLGLELISEPLLKLPQVSVLLLQAGLYGLSLLLGVLVVLYVLLVVAAAGFSSTLGACLLHDVTNNDISATMATELIVFFIFEICL